MFTFAQGTDKEYTFTFVDGGITTYNNPAYLAFQMVTTKPYAINWQTGSDKLLIVSVGTGNAANTHYDLSANKMNLLHHAQNVPPALMSAATAGWDMVCRTIGECRHGGMIDREIGDMVMPSSDDSNFTGAKLFTYMRYDPDVSQSGLNALGLNDVDATKVQVMDSVDYITDIQRVGTRYASNHVDIEHFKGFVG